MIFQFFRQIFHDPEFEKNQVELAEARSIISEYKEIIREKAQKNEQEKNKPDIEFIVLLWASIGLALSVAGNAIEKIPNDVMKISVVQEGIWLIIALVMLVFATINFLFALDLTMQYARIKSDNRYKVYSYTLSIGVFIVLVGLSLIAILDKAP